MDENIFEVESLFFMTEIKDDSWDKDDEDIECLISEETMAIAFA